MPSFLDRTDIDWQHPFLSMYLNDGVKTVFNILQYDVLKLMLGHGCVPPEKSMDG